MTIKLSTKTGGSGGGAWGALPSPPKAVLDGRVVIQGDRIPVNATAIDNMSLTTSYTGYLNTTAIWTVTAVNVNAAADGFMSSGYANWYDSVNKRLYVFAYNNATTPDTVYLAYITIETGAITNIGSFQFSTEPLSPTQCVIDRAAIDSGDFILYFIDRTVIVNSTTGAETANNANANFETATNGAFYVKSGVFFMSALVAENAVTAGGNALRYIVNNKVVYSSVESRWIGSTNASGDVYFLRWGDKVKCFSPVNSTFYTMRTFEYVDFQPWLESTLNYLGAN